MSSSSTRLQYEYCTVKIYRRSRCTEQFLPTSRIYIFFFSSLHHSTKMLNDSVGLEWFLVHCCRAFDSVENVTRHQSCFIHRWFGEKPSATSTEMTAFTRWMWHITDVLLLSLVTVLSLDLWHLQISFEPPSKTLHGIDHASYIVGSVRNQAQQVLRWLHLRDECGT